MPINLAMSAVKTIMYNGILLGWTWTIYNEISCKYKHVYNKCIFSGQVRFLWYDTKMDDEIKLSQELLSFEHSYFQLPSCHGHNRPEYVMKFTAYTSQHFKMTYRCCGTASGYEVKPYHLSFCWNTNKYYSL